VVNGMGYAEHMAYAGMGFGSPDCYVTLLSFNAMVCIMTFAGRFAMLVHVWIFECIYTGVKILPRLSISERERRCWEGWGAIG
jgi:hypothetical protein